MFINIVDISEREYRVVYYNSDTQKTEIRSFSSKRGAVAYKNIQFRRYILRLVDSRKGAMH